MMTQLNFTNFLYLMMFGFIFFSGIACSEKKVDKSVAEESVQGSENEITLERKWQRVVRHNCQKKVVSDQQETVQSPKMYLTIHPDASQNFWRAEFKNKTNSSSITIGGYSFWIDMAPTVFNLKVEEGINEIEYKFFYCKEKKKDVNDVEICAHTPDLGENGSAYLYVHYVQTWLDGVWNIYPSAEECPQ